MLKTFSELSGIRVELEELEEQAHEMGHKLGEVLAQVEGAIESVESEEEPPAAEPVEEPKLTFEQERRIEQLFTEAHRTVRKPTC